MKYDFVLLENTRNTDNHYKDLVIFARILKDCGYSIAIVDLFKEGQMCITPDIQHITLKTKCDKSLRNQYRPTTFIHKYIHIKKKEKYLSKVLEEIKDLSDNFYIGSLFLDFPTKALAVLPKNKKMFVWGLRSTVMTPKRYKRYTFSYYLCKQLSRFLLKKKNLYLVISDEMIADEFIEYGIEKERIVVRPERTTNTLIPIKERESNTHLNLLSIGTLREKKKVYKCIDAIRLLNDDDITYTIAGKSKLESINQIIEEKSQNLNSIIRKNYLIPDEEYQQLLNDCDYLVICDESKGITATSGTMNEALLSGRPIIAPNELPFSYYLKQYSIGILYEFSDIQSLAKAISKAKQTNFEEYRQGISEYQKNMLYDVTVNKLKIQMNRIIRD